METKQTTQNTKELNYIKRKNAQNFTLYKMFSWDILFYYSIQYLFYTITKGVTPGEVLKIGLCYPIFHLVLQFPIMVVAELLGRRKSIILGNSLLLLQMIALIKIPGTVGIIISEFIFSFGYGLKTIQETNLLYDSTATRGGSGLFDKINEKGAMGYYVLDGISSLLAGFLFVIDQYLPIYIAMVFIVISILLSFRFKDIYQNEFTKTIWKEKVKDYREDLKQSFCSFKRSERLRAMILFCAIFSAVISVCDTYRESLLVDFSITPEVFSIIFAILTLVGGISVTFKTKIEKKFKNRTFTFIGITVISSMIIIGILGAMPNHQLVLPLILLLYSIQYIGRSIFYVLEEKYVRNFTTAKTRSRVIFSDEMMSKIAIGIFSFIAGMVLDHVATHQAFLLFGLFFLAVMIVVLEYMRPRFGLRPEEYPEETRNPELAEERIIKID